MLSLRCPRILTLVSCVSLGALGANAQFFDESFESFSVGATVRWDSGNGAQAVDASTVNAFGSSNIAVSMAAPSISLFKNTSSSAIGAVSTFAFDFVEFSEPGGSNGLVVGFGEGADLNNANASIRVQLLDGVISHATISGMSQRTETGVTSYVKGQPYRLFIVVNDTDAELLGYEGAENLPAHSYEVWLRPWNGNPVKVFQATIARNLNYMGFRTWAANDSIFYIDNASYASGVRILSPAFADDFEGYSARQSVSWDASGAGATIVDEAVVDAFGAPNKAARFSGAGASLIKDLEGALADTISTLSLSFLQSGSASGALRIGFGEQLSLHDGAVAAVELSDGRIRPAAGVSATDTGLTGYDLGQPHNLYIVLNDTPETLIDYFGGEDLAPYSFEVWLLTSRGAFVRVMEAKSQGDPAYAGLSAGDASLPEFFADNVQVAEGVLLPGGNSPVSLAPEALGVVVGSSFTVNYSIDSTLPEGATYELSGDGDVSFPSGASGVAGAGGSFEAVVNQGHRQYATLTLTLKDASGGVLASGSVSVMPFDFSRAQELPHPSVINTQEQLDAMRDWVLYQPASIARAGWDHLRATGYAALNYAHKAHETVRVVGSGSSESEDDFRADATAARAHALQWVVTGDPAHRDKALAIMNDWGGAFRSIISETSPAQTQLESAWALPVWLSAADIMRYYDNGAANWDPADMAAFHHFMEVLYNEAVRAMDRGNNWAVSASLAVMAYGAWIDDRAIFELGLNNQLAKLDQLSQPDGEIEEVCRDTWHPQYSVVSWTDSAELAHNLGYDDLYEVTFDGQTIPRLAIILEYFANLMLGNTEPPCGTGWGYDYYGEFRRFDNYEVPYNHYFNRWDVSYLPNFRKMVEDGWRKNVGEDSHFLLWSRLTHGSNDNPSYVSQWGKGVFLPYRANSDRWIDTSGWIGWVNDSYYPWTYQPQVGWLYMTGERSTGGVWSFKVRQ